MQNIEKYQTISEINKYVKMKFQNDILLNKVYLKGEISNLTIHRTGHLYFSIKDEYSRISAVMFKNNVFGLGFKPKNGDKVLIIGKISVYEVSGQYQVYVEKMQKDGMGDLHLQYEKLKKKLQDEGLFDVKYKKDIPKYPNKVGIITAPTGAAIRDINSTINRRYPICKTILFPTLVQGKDAADNIVEQIYNAQKHDIDVLIVGRGGGSIEDLWAFNEEKVARAIFECKIPIVSGIGHEIDFTISDFVSDKRAETPTGAAEVVVPDINDILKSIEYYKNRILDVLKNKLYSKRQIFNSLKDSYIFKNPTKMYESKMQNLEMLLDSLIRNINFKITNNNKDYEILLKKLEILNPISVLKRGYAVIEKDNKIINTVKNIKSKDEISIELQDGKIKAICK